MLGAVVPIEPVHHRRDRDRRHRGAGGDVPLDELRSGDARGVGERDLGHAARPLTDAACADQLGDRGADRRRRRDPRASTLTELDTSTLPLQIVPGARRRGARRACRRRRSPALAGFGIGVMYSLVDLRVGEVVVPDVGRGAAARCHRPARVPVRGRWRCSLRGAKLPGRGQLIERGLPEVPRPQLPDRDRGAARPDRRDRAGRAAVRLPPGRGQHDDRHRDGAVAGRDHRLRRADLGRPAEPRRRHGVRDLAAGARSRRAVPVAPIAGHRGGGACSGC